MFDPQRASLVSLFVSRLCVSASLRLLTFPNCVKTEPNSSSHESLVTTKRNQPKKKNKKEEEEKKRERETNRHGRRRMEKKQQQQQHYGDGNKGGGRRSRTIKRLLIANRGEIACRIIRTCRKLCIATVVVYSQADRNAPFVALADESVFLGASPSQSSYLDADKILQIALDRRVDAIHPGSHTFVQ